MTGTPSEQPWAAVYPNVPAAAPMTHPLAAPPQAAPPVPGHPSSQLLSIIDALDRFTNGQLQKLEHAIECCRQAIDENAALRKESADLELRQQVFEEKQQAEESRMQAEGETLIAAWKKLEDEQRRLLGMRESLEASRATASAAQPAGPAGPANGGPLSPRDELQAPASNQQEGGIASQFHNLRREMQRHAQRKRR